MYPVAIAGLVYVTGQLAYQSEGSMEGVLLVGGSLSMPDGGTLDLTYRDTFLSDPPPGFEAKDESHFEPVPGSWAQVVSN